MRRTLPLVITAVVGALVIFRDIFNIPEVANVVTKYIVMGNTLSVNAAFALGLVQLSRLHFRRVRARRADWPYSVLLLFCIGAMLTMGLVFERGQNAAFYQYWYQMLPIKLGQVMFAMVTYYIASAAYRAFRVRSVEATLLLGSAVLVMLGGVTAGYAIWSGFPELKSWIMNNLNTATVRTLGMGITLGSLAQFARNLFGIERGYMAE